MGQLPRSVDVVLEGDLVDRVKPGDRVRMVGIYRALAGNATGQTSGIFRTVILGNNVLQIGKDVGGVIMTPNDIQNIRAVSKRKNVFNLLARSLDPIISPAAELVSNFPLADKAMPANVASFE